MQKAGQGTVFNFVDSLLDFASDLFQTNSDQDGTTMWLRIMRALRH